MGAGIPPWARGSPLGRGGLRRAGMSGFLAGGFVYIATVDLIPLMLQVPSRAAASRAGGTSCAGPPAARMEGGGVT